MTGEPGERRPGPLARFWEAELAPAVRGLSPRLALVGLFGCALLVNKRYLADRYIVPLPETRWQAVAAWAAAMLVALLVARRVRRPAADLLAVALGALALAAVLSVAGFGWPPKFRSPLTGDPFLMLLLAWLPAAPVVVGLARPGSLRRPVALAALLVLAVALLLTCPGPLKPLLLDNRWDKLNWGLLTFCWLVWLPQLIPASSVAGQWATDGTGLGRWRLWLPWTAGLLVVMVALIAGFAGRQENFISYYPMFRGDWPTYNPATDGWGFLLAYELTYALYFLAWEYFFRGWMLFRLEPELGANAILIQAAPFVLMHIGKPALEFPSALIAGVVLGWLAWRARSFWPCFALHFGAALTMDLVALGNSLARSAQ